VSFGGACAPRPMKSDTDRGIVLAGDFCLPPVDVQIFEVASGITDTVTTRFTLKLHSLTGQPQWIRHHAQL
jgi:hypothetical protein